ncbi:MAG: cupin domain-containing protein [Kribbellaceae bacterium]
MPVVPETENRRTETPNGVMTTLASPTQGQTESLSLWRVAMNPHAQGPHHVFDTEQIWTVLAGDAKLLIDEDTVALSAGDTVILPAGTPRQFTAGDRFEAVVTGLGTAVVSVLGEPTDRGTPPWIA